MAAVDTVTSRKGTLSFSLRAALDELRGKISRYRLYRETMTELSALSSRELADLGLSRAQLRSVAYEAAYGNT
ncbi:DUF1127 domain-containing protein [Phaeobacter sp.]|uniref:DUF1127 domain-containing protein n=1 Tax=Phaeobacter sp. TaxID=1902409 RepID=UPI0025F9D433|nr:DUF1127 domain-containing protein [Phaeobacter sp.]